MTDVLLVRHGQSVWNAQGRWQGQADPPLTELGRSQADAAGALLATREPFDGIVCSPLKRADSTAESIEKHLSCGERQRVGDLVERSAGEWSGLTRPEIEEKYPGWLSSGQYPPGYEHDEDLIVRVRRGLQQAVELVDGDRVLVVAHGGLAYCLEGSFGLPFRHMSNLGARWLTVTDGEISLGGRVDLLIEFDGDTTTPSAI